MFKGYKHPLIPKLLHLIIVTSIERKYDGKGERGRDREREVQTMQL